MSMPRLAGLAVLLALAVPPSALAGPIVIRDTRVTDLGTTPVLGRGYSLSTNTFQSACLKDVTVTAPSYDFDYEFKELDESTASQTSSSMGVDAHYSSWWMSAHVKGSASKSQSKSRNAHHIAVTLKANTYYASVDESGTPLSESAAQLLQREDAPGFFSACGPNYVRGITRHAQFVSIFSYETESKTRDTKFEAELEMNVKKFGGFLGGGGGGSVQVSREFHEQAASRNLTITSRGWGLGKNESASLISYDLETFKAAIKDAFISMQNPLTGRVTSIEIIPWVENTAFQAALDINAEDKVAGKIVPLHDKKDILSMNAEFLTEMERAARARLNTYYQAKMCDTYVQAAFNGSDGKILAANASRKLRNHRMGPADTKPLVVSDLAGRVDAKRQATLWKEYQEFISTGSPSVAACVAKLMADPERPAAAAGQPAAPSSGQGRGIFLKRFIEHPECLQLQAKFVPTKADFEDYCMPEAQ